MDAAGSSVPAGASQGPAERWRPGQFTEHQETVLVDPAATYSVTTKFIPSLSGVLSRDVGGPLPAASSPAGRGRAGSARRGKPVGDHQKVMVVARAAVDSLGG